MENRRFTIFLIFSLILHFIILFIVKMEPVKVEKQKSMTVIDLLDRKKKDIKAPVKKPKSDLLAEKDIDLKKKNQTKNRKKNQQSGSSKKAVPVHPIIKKDKSVKKPKGKPEEKVVKKKIPVKKRKVTDKIAIKPEKKKEKPKTDNQTVEKDKFIPPQIKKQFPKSLADLNTSGVINDIANRLPSYEAEGSDYINLQAVGFKYASYFSKFRKHVENNWNYPRKAAMRGEQGSVVVRFSILKDGTITDVNTVGGSGYPDLDREVMRLLSTIKGFPLPKTWEKDRIKIEGKFLYQLYRGGIRGSFE